MPCVVVNLPYMGGSSGHHFKTVLWLCTHVLRLLDKKYELERKLRENWESWERKKGQNANNHTWKTPYITFLKFKNYIIKLNLNLDFIEKRKRDASCLLSWMMQQDCRNKTKYFRLQLTKQSKLRELNPWITGHIQICINYRKISLK